ncbi:hypothetical protein SLA2020_065250 [Shorea laevis]
MVEKLPVLVDKEGAKVPELVDMVDNSINVEDHISKGKVTVSRNEENVGCLLMQIENDLPMFELDNDYSASRGHPHLATKRTQPLGFTLIHHMGQEVKLRM